MFIIIQLGLTQNIWLPAFPKEIKGAIKLSSPVCSSFSPSSVRPSQFCRYCNSPTLVQFAPSQILWDSHGSKMCNGVIIGRAFAGIPVGHTTSCRRCNSKCIVPIRVISSFMEPSWPIDMKQHDQWSVQPFREFPLGTQMLADDVTPG